MIRVQPLVPLLRELRRFLTNFAKHEMVVLDFHRFPVGFSTSSGEYDDPHPQLIEIIKRELGDILVPNDRPVTMPSVKDTVAKGKKVLVAYNEKKWQARGKCKHKLRWPRFSCHRVPAQRLFPYLLSNITYLT